MFSVMMISNSLHSSFIFGLFSISFSLILLFMYELKAAGLFLFNELQPALTAGLSVKMHTNVHNLKYIGDFHVVIFVHSSVRVKCSVSNVQEAFITSMRSEVILNLKVFKLLMKMMSALIDPVSPLCKFFSYQCNNQV